MKQNEKDWIRTEGVKRGIHASIRELENELTKHAKKSSGYGTVERCILLLEKLFVEQAEGN